VCSSDLARRPAPAVIGVLGPDGPLALPGAWSPQRSSVRVPAAALLAEVDATTPACVCLDVAHGVGPAAKEGVLLRGTGRVRGAEVRVEPDRVTYWKGFDTRTLPLAARKPAARTRKVPA